MLVLVVSPPVSADEPLRSPSPQQARSPDGGVIVVSEPSDGTHVLESATRRELWSMPGWFRWLFVSNDGQCVATGYDGRNLVPQGYEDTLVLVTFWQRGEKVGEVRVKDIYSGEAKPVRTTSHYHWGTIKGFSDSGNLIVERSDGEILKFSACGAE